MDVRILYLDTDDEITTAANRVREADATRIAIVLPYGSRVATSRINFRLLSREAVRAIVKDRLDTALANVQRRSRIELRYTDEAVEAELETVREEHGDVRRESSSTEQ